MLTLLDGTVTCCALSLGDFPLYIPSDNYFFEQGTALNSAYLAKFRKYMPFSESYSLKQGRFHQLNVKVNGAC